MVHDQKFKDLLSSTCQVSLQRIVLDLESEVMRGPGSIITGGNILYWTFCFHVEKPLMPILAVLPMLCVCENPKSESSCGFCGERGWGETPPKALFNSVIQYYYS